MCEGINFCDKVFVFELGFGPEFYSIVEGFGYGEEVDELHEAVEGLNEVADDGCPSDQRGVVEFNLVDKGDVGVDGVEVGDHSGEGEGEQQGGECWFDHVGLIIIIVGVDTFKSWDICLLVL